MEHPNTPVIYAGEHYSTSMLEELVHANGLMPPNPHYIEIILPAGLSYEIVTKDSLLGWNSALPTASREFGRDWGQARRRAILIVPSLVNRIESNILVNPTHPECAEIQRSLPAPIWWDLGLFNA